MKRFFLIPILGLLLALVGCTCTVSENDPSTATAAPTAAATPAATRQPSAAPETTLAPVMPTPVVSPSVMPTVGN